jgi:hypothetical protein
VALPNQLTDVQLSPTSELGRTRVTDVRVVRPDRSLRLPTVDLVEMGDERLLVEADGDELRFDVEKGGASQEVAAWSEEREAERAGVT